MPPLLSDFVRRRRFQAVAPFLKGDVLDLGCGHAGITSLLRPDQLYVGVEGHPVIFPWLLANFPQHSFHLRDLDHDDLRLEGRFDTVVMLAILEHLANPAHLLRQIPEYLKPGGLAVITTPTPGGGLLHRLGARIGLFYREAVDEHETLFDLASLRPILTESGLKLRLYRKFLLGWNQLFICERGF